MIKEFMRFYHRRKKNKIDLIYSVVTSAVEINLIINTTITVSNPYKPLKCTHMALFIQF